MSKFCKNCGKELTTDQRHNTQCSNECANEAKKKEKIKAWLEGEFDGTRKGGQVSLTIRKYLIEQANNKCQLCGWGEINPITGLIPLEIHHINGDYTDNSQENLMVLCPNCHSLTPNYKALNKEGRKERTGTGRKKINKCIDCGASICNGSLRCKNCENKNRQIEKPMTREELKEMIRTMPFTEIGNKYHCTDNNIRKQCDFYNLPRTKKEINNYSDEEWKNI